MAGSTKNGQPVRSASAALANTPGNSASLMIDRCRPGIRRATPDSDALASSDNEGDHHHPPQHQPTPLANQRRRTSWLNEVPVSLMRKASLPVTSSFSPVSSNPTTPAGDQSSWGTATSPGVTTAVNWGNTSGAGSFPWGTGIWNTENRKEPPSRMVEVLQSPTSSNPPNLISTSGEDQGGTTAYQASGEPPIPFAIPLHPTPKTYRSQSYSVGQLDPESSGIPPPITTSSKPAPPISRNRPAAQYSSVQRRSSRPSLLELGHDPATLGRVREDDDDISPSGIEPSNNNWASNQARTIEQLTLENAMLRQAASGQAESTNRFRDRTLSSTSANNGYSMAQTHKLHPIQGSVPEESDLAVEDLEDVGGFAGYNSRNNARRRFSEHSTNLEKQFPTFASLENRTLENIKRAQWQSSLGFGSIADTPQSRRHSFADTLTRHPSSSFPSSSETRASAGSTSSLLTRDEGSFTENGLNTSSAEIAPYISGQDTIPTSGIPTSLHQAYVMPNAFGRQHAALGQPHQNQQLFIVTFKCYRADVFYIQEGTGLEVKTGDLVIVEADRGTDLGTVAHANISWARAKELKDHYAEEHYKWLMLFSRQNQGNGTGHINPGAPPSLGGAPGSAVGGMGPQSQHTSQEPQAAEIKPKLIKRLAQSHEIQTLRDKEGNEAKAKRVCQQKVAEHRLNMEILDAEFQMDWKKLTFYYFADSYINFNSLVTDLFKIYKTRIWMSAINPASFVTPSTGLPPPPGSGMMGYGQDSHTDRRRQHEFGQYGGLNQGISSPYTDPTRDHMQPMQPGMRPPYLDPYHTFGVARQPDAGFGAGIQPQTDPFSSYQQPHYTMMDPNAPDFSRTNGNGAGNRPQNGQNGQNDWTNQFNGLSLNP
ncbi:Suppressor protein PSP1 [Trichophyton interdigitale]|uniref:PSP1 C-terminal domain-containing protein n=1 Tax=Trichophyton interdigitale TaxID=101480 RepID=A0A9P5CX07_9EURO|nr:PSP1 C-terminal domain-containing protein [Trichophyton interdigitale]KAF3894221.1 PSP1 C-terminal domain-containing protein [Trichophyton interdigitale]KAG8208315.1 Suppressor protein PSP1 [Trichophyton interdigitale]